MYEKLDSCPCCNSQDFTNYTICDDLSVSQESFAIMKCTNCGLLVTSPRPSIGNISKYYQSDNYISHTNRANNLTNFLYKLVRNFSLRAKFKFCSALAHKPSILDYGCGTAEFLQQFHDKSWNAYGVEPNEDARSLALEKGIPIVSDIEQVTKKKFAIITLWHVLEHIHDLPGTLLQLRERLSKKGKIIIAVPNHDSYDRDHYKALWAAYDVPRHLYHFNQDTLVSLMKYNGFDLIETKPLKFDAYYVSLLSEQFLRNNLFKYLKVARIGWLSNRWAKRNNNNYSSLTYVFKKT